MTENDYIGQYKCFHFLKVDGHEAKASEAKEVVDLHVAVEVNVARDEVNDHPPVRRHLSHRPQLAAKHLLDSLLDHVRPLEGYRG